MPTIAEKLATKHGLNWDDPIEHLVDLAYLAGQEKATREICDIHNQRIAIMRAAARKCRYYKMANRIIDAWKNGQDREEDFIYSGHYAGDVTSELCSDEWPNLKIKKEEK